ncbi:MAG: EamA family transporter [Hyphomicrobiaceae bacterium]
MPAYIFIAVLAAAACHAGWNSIPKLKLTPFTSLILINVASAVVVLPLAFVVPLPGLDAWPYLIASLVVHLFYYFALTEAYRTGDLSQVYPIARGTAPLLTALAAYFWLGEDPDRLGWLGIAVLMSGIFVMSIAGRRSFGGIEFRGLLFALLTAAAIALYTVIDGIGARVATSAISYITWLFVIDGLAMLLLGVFWNGQARLWAAFCSTWPAVTLGGAMALLSYGTAIWAMTLSPIAHVAAVRETSVVFAAILGVILLKEAIVPARVMAAGIVLCGLIILRLS